MKLTIILLLSLILFCHANSLEKVRPFLDEEGKEILNEAMQYESEEDYKAAAKRYHRLIKRVHENSQAAVFALKEARCWLKAHCTVDARNAYKALVQKYPLYIPYDEVVPEMREVARAFNDGFGTFWGIRDRENSINMYKLIILESPAANVSREDRLALAKVYLEDGSKVEAANTYVELLKLEPQLDDVRLLLCELLLDMSKAGDGDGIKLRAAVRHANFILKRNPDYKRKEEVLMLLTEAKEEEAQRLLGMAKFYLRRTQYRPKAANRYLQDVVREYPETTAAWEAKSLLQKSDSTAVATSPAREKSEK